MSGPLEIARAAWGETMPDWVEQLARESLSFLPSELSDRLFAARCWLHKVST